MEESFLFQILSALTAACWGVGQGGSGPWLLACWWRNPAKEPRPVGPKLEACPAARRAGLAVGGGPAAARICALCLQLDFGRVPPDLGCTSAARVVDSALPPVSGSPEPMLQPGEQGQQSAVAGEDRWVLELHWLPAGARGRGRTPAVGSVGSAGIQRGRDREAEADPGPMDKSSDGRWG
ncbi:hypothetical protein NDU88_006561 [Pleurodeles waltl]|uniref:Uncharacterized protein n=1 Tax=Pleurodeles waltl TaxID=8319 RepID=A0AAV7PLC5_PLEWA|nr:hypothetical protein NDU88_006561 [Pleurodeles waltl]